MSPVRIAPKTPLPAERPVPTERVIASSPAAAPSPEVTRNSDVLLKAYEQQLRQQRMQAIIQSIGGMVSSLQGQPVHGGGRGGGRPRPQHAQDPHGHADRRGPGDRAAGSESGDPTRSNRDETLRQQKLANADTAAAQDARAAEVARLLKSGAPVDEIIAAANPAAAQAGFIKRREQAEAGGNETAVAQRADFEKNHQAKAVLARDYLEGPGRTLGDLWSDKLVTGTFSDLRRSALWRPLATLTGLSDKDLNDTALVESALKSYVIANAKQLGTNPTDRDARIIAAAGGSTSLSPGELREVIGLNERAERQKIIAAAQRHAELTNSGRKTAREMSEIAPIAMPEPSKILKDDVMLATNAPVRQQLVDMKNQLNAHPDDPQAKAAYAKVAANFDRHFGAQMAQAFLDTGGKGWPTK
jgi:hypothetical protein